VLKSQGYATAQFSKNHLGDRNEFLPTVYGLDEWFGNLYHLNAEEEPEELDSPGQKNPARGVPHAWATEVDDPIVDPKFGKVGKRKIEDTGPLTRERMETIDGEVLGETRNGWTRLAKVTSPPLCGSTQRRFTLGGIRPPSVSGWPQIKAAPGRMLSGRR
jgi:arylsulfatase